MLVLTVDKSSEQPVYGQIRDCVIRLVESSALAPGDRLPPTRVLARTAGVHRSSVMRAYGELWALGYLESRPGSYSTVRRRPPTTRAVPVDGPAGFDWASRTPGIARVPRGQPARLEDDRAAAGGAIDLARLSTDRRHTPVDDIRRTFKAALLEQGAELLDYGDPAGYQPLRSAIARRMRVHGVAVTADEVTITAGAQHALDLVLRAVSRPGDRVAVESPTYRAALPLFRLHGVDPVGAPMTPDGVDLDRLTRVFARRHPAFFYTMPSFQNPTGITTSQAHRERLLALCESHDVPIVEDGFEEEMKYFGKAVLPIKSMDRRGLVIYVGTFSKVVFPGLRVGWIAAPRECLDRIVAIQGTSCLAGTTLAQAVAARFLESGLYEAHLRRLHSVYRRRMEALLRGLDEHMPPGVEWTRPSGGYTLLVRVPVPVADEDALVERLRLKGVLVSPGRHCYPEKPVGASFRLSISCAADEQIGEACRRMGRLLAPPAGRRIRRDLTTTRAAAGAATRAPARRR